MSGKIAASGNCNSLCSSTNFNNITNLVDYGGCFWCLFQGCASLTTPPELPATSFGELWETEYNWFQYGGMFYECTSLTVAPELPVTTLAWNCYLGMFWGCTSLTQAPKILPATNLTGCCYMQMFEGCTSLTTPPALPATYLGSGENYEDQCYDRMFKGCTSLTSVPKLPATTLTSACYCGGFSASSMFNGCTSLIVSDTQTAEATHAWHIPETGTFTNETTYNQEGMFTGCLGTRSSDDMSGAKGESHTYYTQNEPI